MNSIAIYVMAQLLKPWTARTLQTHLGQDIFRLQLTIGKTTYRLAESQQAHADLYAPMVQAVALGLMFWLVCWWMYRQKIFIRI